MYIYCQYYIVNNWINIIHFIHFVSNSQADSNLNWHLSCNFLVERVKFSQNLESFFLKLLKKPCKHTIINQ